MKRKIKRFIRRTIGLKNDTDFYSQGGEDAILSNIFNYMIPVKNGFYIDIGAYHPYKHSNTYLLYKAGWTGINVDPRPGSKGLFDSVRKLDKNVEAGIGGSDGTMTYYIVDENSTMNSFSKENLERLNMLTQVKRTEEVPVFTVSSLLKKYPEVKAVDFMNIDTEGFEMEILKGIDFNAPTAPKVISIEQNNVCSFEDVLHSTANKFLSEKGFSPIAKNIILKDVATVFYAKNEFLLEN